MAGVAFDMVERSAGGAGKGGCVGGWLAACHPGFRAAAPLGSARVLSARMIGRALSGTLSPAACSSVFTAPGVKRTCG